LSDSSLATRIQAFDEPDLPKVMIDPKPDLTPREAGFCRIRSIASRNTRHRERACSMENIRSSPASNTMNSATPTGSPRLHLGMTAKRRKKLQLLADELPLPEVYGDQSGEALLIGWGSTYGPIHEAVSTSRDERRESRGAASAAPESAAERPRKNLRELQAHHRRRDEDEGVYGFGQLAMILRARLLRAEDSQPDQDGSASPIASAKSLKEY
jgi:2-oxoglutarate ferredoxin oxidoreductase subunit alpha